MICFKVIGLIAELLPAFSLFTAENVDLVLRWKQVFDHGISEIRFAAVLSRFFGE